MSNLKQQNRIMGEYSISKSFKGILRVAHIVDLVTGEPDVFMNPTYYGSPKQLVNISGGAYASKQKGVQTAEYSLKGDDTISRYNIPQDELKNRRVPMTDSMGNFMNWFVGADGITIGSNENINSNSLEYDIFYQKDYQNYPIYQEKYFPILKSSSIIIGRENKLYSTQKKRAKEASLVIQGNNPKLIIQNLYEKTKSQNETKNGYRKSILYDGASTTEEVILRDYNKVVGDGKKYKKLRTIYNSTKYSTQDNDSIMYRQNDWDTKNYGAGYFKSGQGQDNWSLNKDEEKKFKIKTIDEYQNSSTYNKQLVKSINGKGGQTFYNKGQVLDCNADFVNLTDYVLNIIKKYSKDNIVEVPSGTVIHQFCSLKKWRAYGDGGDDTPLNFRQGALSFTGHRPTLENRTPMINSKGEKNENGNLFFNSTLQGASKKINHIFRLNTSFYSPSNQVIQSEEDYFNELIPLYKRDYLLCDGSVYRIPYCPVFENTNLSILREHKDRFFELFFNIGYTYTNRQKLQLRPSFKYNESNGLIELLNASGVVINEANINDISSEDKNIEWTKVSDIKVNWKGQGAPIFNKNVKNFTNLKDIEVLFGEDLATMLAIDLIYNEFKKIDESKYKNYEEVYGYLSKWVRKGIPLPEEYIFNSFIGDSEDDMKKYWKESFYYDNENPDNFPKIMSCKYEDAQKNKYKFLIGREVNNLSSFIKFYDSNSNKIRIVKVHDLPMVEYFIRLLSSGLSRQSNLRMFCYGFYNYDFQVPSLLSQDGSSTFISSCGWNDSDDKRTQLKKVVQWYTRFSHSTRPHRHAVFAGKTLLNNLNQIPVPDVYKASQASVTSPVNLAGFWGGQEFPFSSWYKKGGTKGKITEAYGNYIINQFYVKTDNVLVNGMNVTVLINDGVSRYFQGEVLRTRYGWKTGRFRTFTPVKNDSSVQNQTNFPNPEFLKKFDDETKLELLMDYYQYNKDCWYSLLPKEDPRFDTSEPNRGISSAPIPSKSTINISYHKIKDNAKGYYTGDKSDSLGFFSPQHITMLPLIKI